MAALAQHLMDEVLPHVATRQWVLSVPFSLRYRLAYDQTLCTAVRRIVAAAVARRLRALARRTGVRGAKTGSVTFVQRYVSGLNLNVHYHLIGLDGWFEPDAQASPRGHPKRRSSSVMSVPKDRQNKCSAGGPWTAR